MDPSLPLTILDYEEFGNPQIQSEFELIFSYSPYDNISQGSCYPSMLVTASLHDSRYIHLVPFVILVHAVTNPGTHTFHILTLVAFNIHFSGLGFGKLQSGW